ncbi:hypothetical protein DPSP01_009360 [Paraphaeosphaeria sporulosa]
MQLASVSLRRRPFLILNPDKPSALLQSRIFSSAAVDHIQALAKRLQQQPFPTPEPLEPSIISRPRQQRDVLAPGPAPHPTSTFSRLHLPSASGIEIALCRASHRP